MYKHVVLSSLLALVLFLTQPSPVSRTGGHDRRSTTADASLDFRSLLIACVVITHPERLTYTHKIVVKCLQLCENRVNNLTSVILNTSVSHNIKPSA